MPVSGSNGYRSGIVTLPNRIRLRDMDSRTGMYPTISKTGDKDRRGNALIKAYSDNDAFVFASFDNLMFGSMTISGTTNSLNPYATANNPNGGLVGTGNILKGISDNSHMTDYKELTFQNIRENEPLTHFDDSRINLKLNSFYLTGTAISVYPGFSNQLKNKTQIQIDLSCNEETTFGHTEPSLDFDVHYGNTFDLSNLRNQLTVYYNASDKKWEKIARGLGGNTPNTGAIAANAFYETLGQMVDEAAVGFSNVGGFVATASVPGNPTPQQGAELYADDVIASIGKPTSVFGFPSHGKFHATGSQAIRMSDYISEPILLEKLNLKFNCKIEFPYNEQGKLMHTFQYISGTHSNPGLFVYEDDFLYFMPTFFMLRQYKTSRLEFKRDFSLKYDDESSTDGEFGNLYGTYKKGVNTSLTYTSDTSNHHDINFTLPGDFKLSSGSDLTTHVDTNRDIVTYGQIAWYAKERDNQSAFFSNISLLDKLPGDKKISLLTSSSHTAQPLNSEGDAWTGVNSRLPPVTGTFEFDFKSRTTSIVPPRYGPSVRIRDDGSGGNWATLGMEYSGGRTLPLSNLSPADSNIKSEIHPKGMNETLRSFVNNIPSYKKGVTYPTRVGILSDTPMSQTEYVDSSTIDLDSPYVLFPEDEIVLGWSYPYGASDNLATTQASAPLVNFPTPSSVRKNTMTLFGNSTLTIFGSKIRNKEEYHDTLNQALTSEAVHEDIGYELSQCLDQYIINTKNEYSGSYLDDHSNGGVESEIRSMIGSGENNLSGSFQRFVKCNNQSERYYDTLKPSLNDLAVFDSRIANITAIGANKSIQLTNTWDKSFIYNNKLDRSKDESFSFGNPTIAQPVNSFLDETGNRSNGSPISVDTLIDPNSVLAPVKTINYNYLVFGFGGTPGTGGFRRVEIQGEGNKFERPRGWKYGIWNAFRETTSAIYRGDKFNGFVCDKLQQRYDTRFYVEEENTITNGPVLVDFVLKPENDRNEYEILKEAQVGKNTFESSNLSMFASSSLPFFDNVNNPTNRSYESLASREVEIE